MVKKIKWGEAFEDFLLKTDSYSQVVDRILTVKKKTLKEYTAHRSHLYYVSNIIYSNWKIHKELEPVHDAWTSYCYLLENHPYLLKDD